VSETKEKGRASALCSRCHLHRRSAALAAPRYRRATEVPMANTDDDDDDDNDDDDDEDEDETENENENENEDEDGQ
jgi:cobalamin biosynthesis protein CobT